jgi:hypothetical protein
MPFGSKMSLSDVLHVACRNASMIRTSTAFDVRWVTPFNSNSPEEFGSIRGYDPEPPLPNPMSAPARPAHPRHVLAIGAQYRPVRQDH